METPKMNTQDLAEELLYAEAHLSVLWEDIPSESGKRTDKPGNSEVTRLQSTGATKRERQNARALQKNQDKIAEVVARAREEGEVPLYGVPEGVVGVDNLDGGIIGGSSDEIRTQKNSETAKIPIDVS